MASGTFYDAWGPTATATDSSNRYHQNHLKVTWSSDNEKVTYTINAYARSGNGSGYYYMSDYGVTVTLYYSLNGGNWQSLGSTSGTLNYNDNVANITKTVTINRTHSSQTIKFKAVNTGNYLNTTTTETSNDTMNAKPSYTVSYNVNGGSGTISNQTKWYNETLTLTTSKPTYSGYSFKNWNTVQTPSTTTPGTSYSSGGSYTVNAAATLYAQWTVDYINPTIGSISAFRSNSSGVAQENSTTHITVVVNWNVDSNYAGSACAFAYKASSDDQYNESPGSNSLSGTSGTTQKTIAGTFVANQIYNIRVKLTDTHGGLAETYAMIPISSDTFKPLSFLAGGTGLAIGKTATVSNKVETLLPIKLQATTITDNITPKSTSQGTILRFRDVSNTNIGFISPYFQTSGTQNIRVYTSRTIENNTYYNGILLGINNTGEPVTIFHDTNCKKAWQKALEPDILFDGEAIPNTSSPYTVTLSSSAANYNHMRIYFKYYNTNKPASSVEVFEPNNKYVNLFIGYAGLNSGLYWPAGTDVQIVNTAIIRRYSFYTSASTTTQRTTTAGSDTAGIVILRVEAWNDAWW